MAIRCPKCGKFLSKDDKTCPNCGAIISKGASFRVSEPKPAPAPKKVVKQPVVNLEGNVKVEKAPDVIRRGSDPVIITKYETIYVEEPLGFDSVSYFDGKLHQYIGWNLLGALVTLVTLGICYPLWYAWLVKWECKHTVLRGYRQYFDGKASSLLPRWLLWYLLTIVTLTIYGWWTPIRLRKWKVNRIRLVKDKKRK